jgi:hypothetical protein
MVTINRCRISLATYREMAARCLTHYMLYFKEHLNEKGEYEFKVPPHITYGGNILKALRLFLRSDEDIYVETASLRIYIADLTMDILGLLGETIAIECGENK